MGGSASMLSLHLGQGEEGSITVTLDFWLGLDGPS